jgi:hypothetical protein
MKDSKIDIHMDRGRLWGRGIGGYPLELMVRYTIYSVTVGTFV